MFAYKVSVYFSATMAVLFFVGFVIMLGAGLILGPLAFSCGFWLWCWCCGYCIKEYRYQKERTNVQ